MKYAYSTNKKDQLLEIFIGILIAVFILSFETVTLAADSVDCPDTINPGETVTLRGPCTGVFLKITGPARLNLNGFTWTCDVNKNGIRLLGEGAKVHNGTITGCNNAVALRGDGHHQILNLTVDNSKAGILVEEGSSDNDIINNTARSNTGSGFEVEPGSYDNKLINNLAEYNNKGFKIDGDDNNIVGNEANNNIKENFQVKGNNNRLVNNTANGGPEECFLIGDREQPPVGAGSDENQLVNNDATGCRDGIVFSAGAEGNSITNNTALGNVTDLIDEDCVNNYNDWKNNKFESSNDTCIE